MWQFITDHTGDVITLTLRSDALLEVWRVNMDRYKAGLLADIIDNGSGGTTSLWVGGYTVSIVGEGLGGCIIMVDNGTYMIHKIVLSKGQRQDLASTLRIHIRASELDTRPKDTLPPLDDSLPGQWTPAKEKEAYGLDGPEDTDPADFWKK